MTKKILTKRANSKQPLVDYSWNNSTATIIPDFSFSQALDMVQSDPVAMGAVQHFVDKCMEGDWSVIKKDKGSYDKSFEDLLRYKYKFSTRVLRQSYLVGKLYNNVFIEIVRDGKGGVKDLNTLDSQQIDVITKPNGDVLSYKSKLADPKTGKYPTWNANDIVWVKFNNIDNGYAPVDIKSLFTTLQQKQFINRFISWAWKTGQYRVIHNFKNSDSRVVEDFIAYNSKVENDFTKPFIGGGEYQRLMLRDMEEIKSLTEYLKHLDNQIVIALRIPPVDVGIPESSGRSNADAQGNNLVTHIKGWKNVMSDSINELFTKMVHGNNAFKYAPSDRFTEEMVLKNVQLMQSMNMSDEVMKEYLSDNGMFFTNEKLFKEVEELGADGENPRDLDTMPSRTGKSKGTVSKKIGTGSQGTTREDQL